MAEWARKVTRKGQVTLPAAVRRSLGIQEGERVTFVLEGREVRLVPTGSIVARTAGALKGRAQAPRSAKALRRAAEEAMAADVRERAGER